ncbi:hypothetical protein B7P43_G10746 [Cryptotermes secundus]|uniref:DDE-1 domain-containing protein n=1 Tax=Cryptotermes secundus TaxID=105785 RepID=A0A2J7R126_9NEOP|nr:hypothetical protein B7P43_G10746 [Cryptotermes secundus]
MNLPLHVLLVMDNAPAHPPDLQDDLLEEFKFIKIQFLPPNTTLLLQPLDKQVISKFKKLYTKALFERCFEVTEATNLTLKEFRKYHFHIVACLKMIEKAWEGVTKRTLTSAWKKLWPESIVEHDFEGYEIAPVEPVVNKIVSLAKIMGLEVDNNDIDELVEEQSQELTTEELMELHCVSQQEVVEESLSEEEEEEVTAKQQSSGAIREMLKAWETVASYIEKHHPNKAVDMCATNLFNDNAVSHFHQILKHRQKQMSLDSYLVKKI